jgi:hypothetical protein
LLLVESSMSWGIQFSHTMAIWSQPQYDEPKKPLKLMWNSMVSMPFGAYDYTTHRTKESWCIWTQVPVILFSTKTNKINYWEIGELFF